MGLGGWGIVGCGGDGTCCDKYFYTNPQNNSLLQHTGITGKPILKPQWVIMYNNGVTVYSYNDTVQVIHTHNILRQCKLCYKLQGVYLIGFHTELQHSITCIMGWMTC